MRLVGERKALGAMVFALVAGLFILNALLLPPAFGPMFWGLVGIYGTAYFGIVAGWFWARWYASGVALAGVSMAVMMAIQMGLEPIVFIWGGAHALVYLCLLGDGPRGAFDGRAEWRSRYRMDEAGVQRLGKSVQRAGTSLPFLVMAALGPKEGGMAIVALALGAAGVWGLLRLRTWGVFALAGAGLASAVAFAAPLGALAGPAAGLDHASSLAGAVLVGLAILPLARPVLSRLLARDAC